MAGKHTPGPWVIREGSFIDGPGFRDIASVRGAHVPWEHEAQANARLISEAPAMAEALRAVVALAELHIAERSATPEEEEDFLACAYLVNARAILARIDGDE